MTFYIEKIKIELNKDMYGLRLNALNNELPLPNQSIEETKDIVAKNFEIVKEKYYKTSSNTISIEDINEVCLRIVLHYFYLYNLWRNLYEKEKNRSLTFQVKDFSHPNTYNEIIQFFKNKYPKDYAGKCAVMIDIKIDALLKYEADRDDFYNWFR